MRVTKLTIENCKSYRLSETIDLDRPISILVGPNAGGKSNTLDITTVVLRRFFLPSYATRDGREAGEPWKDLQHQALFENVGQHLERHYDLERDPTRIEIEIAVGATDVENMQTIRDRRDDLAVVLSGYRRAPYKDLKFTESWDLSVIEDGQRLSYSIVDGNLQPDIDEAHRIFREYLQRLHMFMVLGEGLQDFEIRPTLLYFSPYRGAGADDLRATLSSETFLQLLNSYFNTTSHTSTSLIKLASAYFAEKRRRLEVSSGNVSEAWETDRDVSLVSRYLYTLGYQWSLEPRDVNKNTYEVILKREDRDIPVGRASSGEKEILNFLLGIGSLGTRGGMVIIDEPELHLHPRWQAVLRDLLHSLAITTGNQIVLSTHSPVFVSPETIGNVVRVARDDTQTTRTTTVPTEVLGDQRGLVHMINSHNNERILFADRVLLVEGIKDRIMMDAIVRALGNAADLSEVVEVVEVHGKHQFARYGGLLEALRVKYTVMADLDHAVSLRPDAFEGLLETKWSKIDVDVLHNKKSRDRRALAEVLEGALADGCLQTLEELWRHVKDRYQHLRSDLEESESTGVREALEELRGDGIHILERGEIEDCLPSDQRSLDAVIKLSRPPNLAAWFETAATDAGASDLLRIASSVLGIEDDKLPTLCRIAADRLRALAIEKAAEREASATVEVQIARRDSVGMQPDQN